MKGRRSRRREELPPDIKSVHLIQLKVSKELISALEAEVERLTTRKRRYTVAGILRTLIATYLEKRRLGLIAYPDD